MLHITQHTLQVIVLAQFAEKVEMRSTFRVIYIIVVLLYEKNTNLFEIIAINSIKHKISKK